MNSEWIMCPICGNKTRDKIREDTELKNFPLYCPKCKQESLIDAKNLQITVIKSQTQRRRADELEKCFTVRNGSVTTFMLGYCLSQGIEVVIFHFLF